MTNKFVLVMLLLSFILGITFLLVINHLPEEKKAVAKIMYSAPIGPTQEPPYQLPSKYIGDDNG